MSTELAIPGSVSETALELPADLPFDDWLEAGELLGRIGRACQWWLGDWLRYGEWSYGDKYAQAVPLTGYEERTLQNNQWVAERIETSRRREVLSWGHHAEVASLEPDEQDDWLNQAEAERWSVHELRRRVRRPQLVSRNLPDGVFDVLYGDPPWRYEHVKTDSRAVENQYPTMELDEIKALEIPAADDAVLFLWATSPKVAEALEVLEAWDFTYRTCMVWVKDKIGMGYYARQQHELLLIAAKGNAPIPGTDVRPASVVHAPRTQHSAKPAKFYELLESMYPDNARLELFARAARPGWTSWGNEVEVAA